MGRSECLRCHRTADDQRGLPYGHYAVNGQALTAGQLQAGYACPICLRDINPRVVLGELRILCAGPEAHDVVALGRAMPKAKRDYVIEQQRRDAADALYGLRGVSEMPILDLQQDAGARLKRAGIIRLGIKKKSERTGKMYPAETPHFVLKDASGLADIYGLAPKRLNVYLPFNEVDRNLIAWHQNWVAGGLICRGDGERIEYAVDAKTGEVIVKKGQAAGTGTFDGIKMTVGHPVKCPGLSHDLYPRCRDCRPNALLIVLIREVSRLAYYQIATSSIHNIVNLTGQMRWVKENIGRLQGVPFILERRPDSISTPGNNGKRVRREKYLLHLEPDPEWVKAMMAEMCRRALPGGDRMPALPASVDGEEVIDHALEVAKLDDEPIWEPVEHYDDEQEQDEAPPDDANDEAGQPTELPRVGKLTSGMVAQARAVLIPTSEGHKALGALGGEEFEKVVAWIKDEVDKRPEMARAIAVLLAESERVILNKAAWAKVQLPDGIVPQQFEVEARVWEAFALSWSITPEGEPAQWVTWAQHFRSAADVGDGDVEAAAFADGKVQIEALEAFAEEAGAEVSELDE